MNTHMLHYKFYPVHRCNMCGSDAANHAVLGKRLNQSQGRNPGVKTGITVTVVRCKECGLVYSNPLPVPVNIQDHYGVPPESYWKENYFVVDDNYFQNEVKRAKSLISFKEGMKSLDIGAGLGKAMISLARNGFDAYGFEPSEVFFERAISKMKISRDKLKLGAIEEIEYPGSSFDFITFGAVLEHLYDPSLAIQKAMNWLKPGGVIHIEVPSSDWLIAKFLNLYYKLRGTDYVSNISPMHQPYHLYEFTLKSFQKNAIELKYEIAFHEYYVCDTYLPKFLDYLVVPYMRWTRSGMQLSVWLKKEN